MDQIVPIDEAARIYSAAKHPKSFISLDNADHLLSNKADAVYIATIVSSWIIRYLNRQKIQNMTEAGSLESNFPIVPKGTVIVRECDKKFTREIFTEQHRIISDEPIELGGADLGANPYELLLAALGSCTSMTLRMYANHKQLDLETIEVKLQHSRIHVEDCSKCEKLNSQIDKISRSIKLIGQLNIDQRKRLLEIANQCPLHKTLTNKIVIETNLDE